MDKNQSKKNLDIIISVVLMLISIGVIVLSIQMPWVEEPIAHPLSSAGVVPLFIGIMLFALNAVLFFQSIKGSNLRGMFSKELLKNKIKESRNFLITFGLTISYSLIFLGKIHYVLITGLFIFIFIVLFEYTKTDEKKLRIKKIINAAIIAILGSVTTFIVFEKLFLVHLP